MHTVDADGWNHKEPELIGERRLSAKLSGNIISEVRIPAQ
jgi:hypothetical protein